MMTPHPDPRRASSVWRCPSGAGARWNLPMDEATVLTLLNINIYDVRFLRGAHSLHQNDLFYMCFAITLLASFLVILLMHSSFLFFDQWIFFKYFLNLL